jgi:hypothetical protein
MYLYAASVALLALDISIAFEGIHSLLMVPDVPLLDREDLANQNEAIFFRPLAALFVFNVRGMFRLAVSLQKIQANRKNSFDTRRIWLYLQFIMGMSVCHAKNLL